MFIVPDIFYILLELSVIETFFSLREIKMETRYRNNVLWIYITSQIIGLGLDIGLYVGKNLEVSHLRLLGLSLNRNT